MSQPRRSVMVNAQSFSHILRILKKSRYLHLALVSVIAHPPCAFVRCSVAIGTLNVAPCQMYHAHSVESCCTCWRVGESTWAKYHIFARIYSWTYWILCARHSVLPYAFRACARTFRIVVVQLT